MATAIQQTLGQLSQSLTASFAPGTSLGAVDQTLAGLAQTVQSSFTAGAVVASLHQTLSPVQQSSQGYVTQFVSATITQSLPALDQVVVGTFLQLGWVDPGDIPPGQLIYERPFTEELIWG